MYSVILYIYNVYNHCRSQATGGPSSRTRAPSPSSCRREHPHHPHADESTLTILYESFTRVSNTLGCSRPRTRARAPSPSSCRRPPAPHPAPRPPPMAWPSECSVRSNTVIKCRGRMPGSNAGVLGSNTVVKCHCQYRNQIPWSTPWSHTVVPWSNAVAKQRGV